MTITVTLTLSAVEDLLAFQKSEFSHENLMFIMTVYRFQAMYPSFNYIRTDKLVSDAQQIYDLFISDESTNMVNISADVRESKCQFYLLLLL